MVKKHTEHDEVKAVTEAWDKARAIASRLLCNKWPDHLQVLDMCLTATMKHNGCR